MFYIYLDRKTLQKSLQLGSTVKKHVFIWEVRIFADFDSPQKAPQSAIRLEKKTPRARMYDLDRLSEET